MTRVAEFVVLCLLIFLSAASDFDDDQPHLEYLLKDGDLKTDLMGKSSDFIVLLGNTGSGKSALSKFVRKDRSLSIVKNEQGDHIFVDNDVKIGSTDAFTSKTFYPNVDVDEETGILMIDCAGFQDTRSSEFELVAAFFNKKILDAAQRLKILILVSDSNLKLNYDRAGFAKVLGHVTTLIGSNYKSFEHSIALISTKAESRKTDDEYRSAIKAFVVHFKGHVEKLLDDPTTNKTEQYSRQIALLSYLIKGNQFGVFRRPNEVGSPWELLEVKSNYEGLRDLIFEKLSFSTPFGEKFKVTISPETVNYVNDKLRVRTNQAILHLSKKIRSKAISDFDKMVKNTLDAGDSLKKQIAQIRSDCVTYTINLSNMGGKNFNEYHDFIVYHLNETELWIDMKFQINKLEFLHSVQTDSNGTLDNSNILNLFGHKKQILDHVQSVRNFQSFLLIIIDQYGKYSVELNSNLIRKNAQKLVDLESYRNFASKFQEFGFSQELAFAAFCLAPSQKEIQVLKRVVQTYTAPDILSGRSLGTAYFTGRNCILSQIVAKIKEEKLERVKITGMQKFFVDCDLELKDTHLAIIAPELEIVGGKNRTILLTGSDCHNPSGCDGFSSGNVQIFASRIINAEFLQLKSKGGNGARGEMGANGVDARVGAVPSYVQANELLEKDLLEKLLPSGYRSSISLKEIKAWKNESTSFLLSKYTFHRTVEVVVKNEDGTAPGDGFEGKPGGSAGAPGKLNVLVDRKEDAGAVNRVYVNGAFGGGGEGGKPGRSGTKCTFRKYVCDAEFTNEFVTFVPVTKIFTNFLYDCSNADSGNCKEMYPKVNAGKSGKSGNEFVENYKYQDTVSILELVQGAFLYMGEFETIHEVWRQNVQFFKQFLLQMSQIDRDSIANNLQNLNVENKEKKEFLMSRILNYKS